MVSSRRWNCHSRRRSSCAGRRLDRLDRLTGPQREALAVAFGLHSGGAPDRFLAGLGVLSLLSDVAMEQRLLCLIDDAQWLDQASAQALAFVARRLDAEPAAVIFGTRDPAPGIIWLAFLSWCSARCPVPTPGPCWLRPSRAAG